MYFFLYNEKITFWQKKIGVLLNLKIIDAGATYSMDRLYALTKWNPRWKQAYTCIEITVFQNFTDLCLKMSSISWFRESAPHWKKYIFSRQCVRPWMYALVGVEGGKPDTILVHRNYTELNNNQWATCQIRKIAGCACGGNAGNVFPATMVNRSRHASRHVRDTRAVMHAGIAN